MSREGTNAQKIGRALRVEIKVADCDYFIRTDKSELQQLKNALGGWENFEVDLRLGGTAYVRVIPARPSEQSVARRRTKA